MKFLSDCAVKSIEECVAGELVRVPYSDTSALAIVLRPSSEGIIVGYLSAPDELPSYYSGYDTSDLVVSFGTEWALDPLINDTNMFPGNATALVSGTLVVTPEGPAIMFKASRSTQGKRVYHLLSDWSLHGGNTNSFAPIPGYVIWPSEADVSRDNASPLFLFGSAADDE